MKRSRQNLWRVGLVLVLAALLGWGAWRALTSHDASGPAPSVPPSVPPSLASDTYEGSSGMGVDGFGGFPSHPPPADAASP